MVTPTRDEIRAKALELYMQEAYRTGLKDIPTPEDYELKEDNYWQRAQRELMTSPEAAATDELLSYLEYSASELEEVAVKSEDLKKLLEASRELESVEEKIRDLKRKRKIEQEQAKLRIAELESKLAEGREKAPPAPPAPPKGLGKEQIEKLEATFRRIFEERGARVPLTILRDEIETIKDTLKDVERGRAFEIAEKRIVDIAMEILGPRPPPTVAPPPARPPERPEVVVPPVELLGPRRRQIETVQCWVPDCFELVAIDRDLMRRVTLVPVTKAWSPRGTRFEPLLLFPPTFFYSCDTHRYEKFGYRSIYDALAYLLFESRSSTKRLIITKGTFTEVGLDREDILAIQVAEAKWIAQS